MATLILTIGHNVGDTPTHSTDQVAGNAAEILGVDGMTAYKCAGLWQGEGEESTRLEMCGLTLEEAAAICDRVPQLAKDLGQVCIAAELRDSRFEFIYADDEQAQG